MTIECRCPYCGGLCGFPAQHRGRRARCSRCDGRFIVPDRSGQTPEKAKEEQGCPQEGFYYSALVLNWKAFVKPENVISIVFFASMVSLQYFFGWADMSAVLPGFVLNMPIGTITMILTWGALLWYYQESLMQMTAGESQLPALELDAGFAFLGNVFKSFYAFILSFALAVLPFTLISVLLEAAKINIPFFGIVLLIGGLYLFPMLLLTLSSAPDVLSILRLWSLIRPIVRAPLAYLFTAAVTAAALLALAGSIYAGLELKDAGQIPWFYLLGCLAVQVFMVFAMRTVGLFYQHYECWFGW